MKIKIILREIESLIKKGETEQAIEKTEVFLKETNSSLFYDCVLISNQFHDLKKEMLLNIRDGKEESVRIVHSLLDIIKRIKEEFDINNNIAAVLEECSVDIERVTKSTKKVKKENQIKKHKLENYTLATKSERLVGYLIDSMIFYVSGLLLFLILGGRMDDFFKIEPISMFSVLLGGIVSGGIGMLLYPIFSGNLGHRVVGLKVVCAKTGKNQDQVLTGGAREFLKSTLGYIVLPLMWLYFDENKQNLYDKLTHTVVIRRQNTQEA